MPILSVNQVSKRYGDIKALDNLSFDHQGGFYALLGQNGAGKSTLFQLLSGLFVPDTGTIEVAGMSLQTQMVPALNEMGIVFQQASLDLDMSVAANLIFYGRLRGLSKSALMPRIEQILDQLGLLERINAPCRQLSDGNRRKVELARALLCKPKLLLMDEATVGLDPASRESLVKYVYQLCEEQNIAALWATHLVDEALQAKQILLLHHGQLLATGSASQLIEQTQQADLLSAFLALTSNDKVAA